MIFVIGGAFQGKHKFVNECLLKNNIDIHEICEGTKCELNESGLPDLKNIRVIYDFHILIKRIIESTDKNNKIKNAKDDTDLDDLENIKEIIINMIKEKINDSEDDFIIVADEIGSGLVPIDKKIRAYREAEGRICCEVAKEAKEVYRVYCSIAKKIK